MSNLWLIWCCRVGYRFLRKKSDPWWALTIAPLKLLCSSGDRRTYEQLRYLRALGQINFIGVYDVLDSLIW